MYTVEQILGMLSANPQPKLPWYARWFAFLTTPFKFLGIKGWTDTEEVGLGRGVIWNIQHSTDGFYTIDVQLYGLKINNEVVPVVNQFIRLEVEPCTEAHAYCKAMKLQQLEVISFGGKIYIDADGPFLEIHPTNELILE